MVGAAALAGCSGVVPYSDQGPKNLTLELNARQSGFWTSRSVYLDVFRGVKASGLDYLGTTEFTPEGRQVGLPVGQPLHLTLAFEENSGFGSYASVGTVELPMRSLGTRDRWQIVVTYTRAGFEHDMRRVG